MPATGAAASLSLSQIQSWGVEYLEEAAQRWSSTAQLWEDSFESVHRGSLNPGGTVREGEAAEAAQQRTFADLVKVRGLAEVLREASSTARWGASDLQYAQRNAMTAIEAAQAAGFTVGEDLSVSDPTPLESLLLRGGRQAQAEELAADIAFRATALSALDQEVATNIITITAPLHETSFDETLVDNPNNDIQALDSKRSPAPDDPTNGDEHREHLPTRALSTSSSRPCGRSSGTITAGNPTEARGSFRSPVAVPASSVDRSWRSQP